MTIAQRVLNVKSTLWRDKADRAWGELIVSTGQCERCGKILPRNMLAPHHLISKSEHLLRHCILNGMALCVHCHTSGPWSAHGHPRAFNEWLMLMKPERWQFMQENRHPKGQVDYKAAFEGLQSVRGLG